MNKVHFLLVIRKRKKKLIIQSKTLTLADRIQFSHLEKKLQFTDQAPPYLSRKSSISFPKALLFYFPNCCYTKTTNNRLKVYVLPKFTC